jgi:hypothetical protein
MTRARSILLAAKKRMRHYNGAKSSNLIQSSHPLRLDSTTGVGQLRRRCVTYRYDKKLNRIQSRLTAIHRRIFTELKIQGICWECHGLEIAYFDGPTNWVRPRSPTKYRGSWNNIRQDCAACDGLKNLLQVMISGHAENVFHPHDLSVSSSVENIGEGRCTPRYLKVKVFQRGNSWFEFAHRGYAWAKCIEAICLTPSSISDQSDAALRDLSLVKSWIDKCEEDHSEYCEHARPFAFPLRVIHCASHQLCFIDPGTPYACLSYVWGRQTIAEGDFPGIPSCLPKTIEDSIHVALQLGIPYLWIDRYCIDQSNDSEKLHLIQNMDAIYSGSAITIIAASGQDPHHGLPGINDTPCREQVRNFIEPDLTVLRTLLTDINNTIWSTRAWTYQELELSRRLLIFTDSQMHFQCPSMSGIPSLHISKTADLPLVSTMNYGTENLERFLEFYWARNARSVSALFYSLIDYYRRHTSHPEDIVRAFMGIINALELHADTVAIRATQIQGLPVVHSESLSTFCITRSGVKFTSWSNPTSTFAFSLGWNLAGNESWNEPVSRSQLFPSWSWASVKADRRLQSFGRLNFYPPESAELCQFEDLRAWVTLKSGDRVELEYYVSRLKNYVGEELGRTLYMRSWVTILDSALVNQTGNAVPTLGGSNMYAKFPDYPMYQPRTDLVAMHIGSSLHWPERPNVAIKLLQRSTIVRCMFLILEKQDDLTWRRVGIQSGSGEVFGGKTPQEIVPKAQEFLIGIDMKGIWGVRNDWELRTLCLI